MIKARVCSRPGCPVIYRDTTKSGKCPEHRAEAERVRGNSTERGYGYQHRVEGGRAIAGATHCVTCGEAFTESNPAVRSHKVALRNGGSTTDGYEADCRRCNSAWSRTGL